MFPRVLSLWYFLIFLFVKCWRNPKGWIQKINSKQSRSLFLFLDIPKWKILSHTDQSHTHAGLLLWFWIMNPTPPSLYTKVWILYKLNLPCDWIDLWYLNSNVNDFEMCWESLQPIRIQEDSSITLWNVWTNPDFSKYKETEFLDWFKI